MSLPVGWNTQSTKASSVIPPAANSSSAQIAERRCHAPKAAIPANNRVIHVTVPEADSGESSPSTCASRKMASASSVSPPTSSTVW